MSWTVLIGSSCNWLGGQAVADEVAAPGFDCAGFVNISTSDNIVHGQVKQAGKFSFVRIYESGHEVTFSAPTTSSEFPEQVVLIMLQVPFYQPLAALTIFERAINGKDIATGELTASKAYLTEGAKDSAYREGNSTIQFSALPANATYNHTTNAPNTAHQRQKSELVRRRGIGLLSSTKKFKPLMVGHRQGSQK